MYELYGKKSSWPDIQHSKDLVGEPIMEVFIEHLGDVQFEIKAREHTIIADQPAGEWRLRRGNDSA